MTRTPDANEFDRIVMLALAQMPTLATDPAFIAAVRKAVAHRLGLPAPRLH